MWPLADFGTTFCSGTYEPMEPSAFQTSTQSDQTLLEFEIARETVAGPPANFGFGLAGRASFQQQAASERAARGAWFEQLAQDRSSRRQ
jgi:hypothetical protein